MKKKDSDSVIRKIIKILLLVFWMALIFSFSMDNGNQSEEKSNSFLIWIGENIFQKDFTKEDSMIFIEKYSFIIRKAAHFTLYFVLGTLFITLLKEYHPLTRKDIYLTIAFVLLYSISDEIHQLFSYERSGQISDILLDTTSGILSSISYYYFEKKISKKRQK